MTMRFRAALALVIFAILLVLARAGWADVVYTSRAAFDAAVPSQTVITFDGIAEPGSFVGFQNGPLTLSGVTFTSNGQIFVIDPGFYDAPYPSAFLSVDFATSGIDVLTAVFPPTMAVGFDFGGLFGPATFDILLSDGFADTQSSDNSPVVTGVLDFVGYTSTTPLTSIQISMPDAPNYNAIDNFTIASVFSVSEPGMLGVIAIGLVGLAWLRGRIRMPTRQS